MTSILTRYLVWTYLFSSIVVALNAKPTTPAVGSNDRKTIMDTMRELPGPMEHAADAGGKIVFKVRTLYVEDRVALADVTPCTEDLKKSYPDMLVFLRRGGDEPWAVAASGSPSDAGKNNGWAKTFLNSDDGSDFAGLWAVYKPGDTITSTSASTSDPKPKSEPAPGKSTTLTEIGKGNPDRDAILKVIGTFSIITEMEKDLGKDIVFGEVSIKKSGTWAWFEGNPRTADRIWQGEPVVQLLQKRSGKWEAVTGIPEEVLTAEDSDAAYIKWRKGLLKKYPDLSAELVPEQ